ncbi:MAG: hypothetical protein A3F72_10065 [Bacteroidetes bacterium RIFCSPLOWO2_12_FULL_35_15]|nr:MAG: hypothetical protein A3F72_10065 [Bacteroidetes bacterium RIFCSPLOWO2_12_FULL_35_15]
MLTLQHLAGMLSYINRNKKIKTMKTKKIVIDNRPKFKLQLDNRTTITVRSTIALKAWQERYPAAKILD